MPRRLEDILSQHGASFRDAGRDEILMHCPLCGDADPSEHLAVSTRNRGWHCLRNPRQHRGRSYVNLLKIVLGCSDDRARELLGVEEAIRLPDKDEFALQWRGQLGMTSEPVSSDRKLAFPKEFRPLTPLARRSDGFWDYLIDNRGYSPWDAEWVAEAYDMQYALSGKYAYRIIIPIQDRADKLMTWTARTVADADIRYMTLGKDDHREAPGNLLVGLPILAKAKKRKCLVVCEGPFDAITVSLLGHEYGVWGTCLFGLNCSKAQADLLTELADDFGNNMWLALDPEASFRVLGLRGILPRCCKPLRLPEGVEDPGALNKVRFGRDFVQSLAK